MQPEVQFVLQATEAGRGLQPLQAPPSFRNGVSGPGRSATGHRRGLAALVG